MTERRMTMMKKLTKAAQAKIVGNALTDAYRLARSLGGTKSEKRTMATGDAFMKLIDQTLIELGLMKPPKALQSIAKPFPRDKQGRVVYPIPVWYNMAGFRYLIRIVFENGKKTRFDRRRSVGESKGRAEWVALHAKTDFGADCKSVEIYDLKYRKVVETYDAQ